MRTFTVLITEDMEGIESDEDAIRAMRDALQECEDRVGFCNGFLILSVEDGDENFTREWNARTA